MQLCSQVSSSACLVSATRELSSLGESGNLFLFSKQKRMQLREGDLSLLIRHNPMLPQIQTSLRLNKDEVVKRYLEESVIKDVYLGK